METTMAEKNPAAEGEAGGRAERAEARRLEDRDRVLGRIAARELFMRTLKVRNSDRLDLHECHVERIRAALVAAFEAGRDSRR